VHKATDNCAQTFRLISPRQNRTLDFGRFNRRVSLWTNKKVTAELRKSVTLVAVSILHRLKKKPMFLRFISRGIESLLGKRNVEKTLNWGNAVLLFSATRFSFYPNDLPHFAASTDDSDSE